MGRRRMTKTEKLLRAVERNGGMTHKEIVQFLLRGTGNPYGPQTRTRYDSMLYGTPSRPGLFGRVLVKDFYSDPSTPTYVTTA